MKRVTKRVIPEESAAATAAAAFARLTSAISVRRGAPLCSGACSAVRDDNGTALATDAFSRGAAPEETASGEGITFGAVVGRWGVADAGMKERDVLAAAGEEDADTATSLTVVVDASGKTTGADVANTAGTASAEDDAETNAFVPLTTEVPAGFSNEARSEGHDFPSAAGIAYVVAQTRVCISLEGASHPPSGNWRDARYSRGLFP